MKVLLVGDLRPVNNYGAVATTDALISLINNIGTGIELDTIDYRSMMSETPVYGWPPAQANHENAFLNEIKRKLKVFLGKCNILPFFQKVKKALRKEINNVDQIPNRLDNYDECLTRIRQNNFWQYEKKKLQWTDIVLINGEGNIVNGTDKNGIYRRGGRYLLFFAYVTKTLYDKPCYFVNHTVDPKNRDIKKIIMKVYPMLEGVYVREKLSYKLLTEWGINHHTYVPDALWSHDFDTDRLVKKPDILADFDFSKPYICLGDSSGMCNKYTHIKWSIVEVFSQLIDNLKSICPQIIFVDGYCGGDPVINEVIRRNHLDSVNFMNCNYHELYYVLKNAKLFISGRWHASIISLMAHTPILLWGADSHKTEALYYDIDYPYEFFDIDALPLNIDRIVLEAGEIMSESHDKIWTKVEKLKIDAKRNVDML